MTTTTRDCLFCDRFNKEKHTIIAENESWYARWDNFPVTQGHAQVVAKNHIESFFELTSVQLEQLYGLIKQVKDLVDKQYHPAGYNIGVNEGEAAGRTIHHLHIHLIPRYEGDVPNPRGGVRNIIPGKGDYQGK